MTSSVLKLTTAGSTNLTKVGGPQKLKGLIGVNTAAYEIFVKFYWFIPTASAEAPTVGTTVPDMTIGIPALGTTTGTVNAYFQDGVMKNGVLYFAVTKLAADTDTTVVVAGDGIISVLYE